MFDMDILRNKQLIEEMHDYENSFISIEDIIKSDEMDYYNCPQYDSYILGSFESEEYSNMEEFSLEFEFEDYLDQLRDEQLIEERMAYELSYSLQILENSPVEEDLLDILADSFEEYHMPDFVNPDFFDDYFGNSSYFEECDMDAAYYEDDCYFEEINMDAAYCGNRLFGYVVDDNESFEEFDYPEGPDENLGGFRYPEPDYYDFSDSFIEIPDDFYDCPEPDYEIIEYYGADLFECEEAHMQKLIRQHIAEEKQFMELISKQEIPDEYLPPELAGEIIDHWAKNQP